MTNMEKEAKIYVAGHRGMVGSAIVRALQREGYQNIVTRSHQELNLCQSSLYPNLWERELNKSEVKRS